MDFDKALALVLDLEGRVFTNHPLDLGGPTYCGITQDTYNGYCHHRKLTARNVGSLTQAEIAEVYRAIFWNLPQDSEGKPVCELLPYPASVVFFQLGVNVGADRATKLLQAALMVEPDGHFGPASRSTLITMSEVGSLSQDLLLAQLAHYATVEEPWDAKGLFNRVQRVWAWVKKQQQPTSGRSRSASVSASA